MLTSRVRPATSASDAVRGLHCCLVRWQMPWILDRCCAGARITRPLAVRTAESINSFSYSLHCCLQGRFEGIREESLLPRPHPDTAPAQGCAHPLTRHMACCCGSSTCLHMHTMTLSGSRASIRMAWAQTKCKSWLPERTPYYRGLPSES
jgi:hypothetical protein